MKILNIVKERGGKQENSIVSSVQPSIHYLLTVTLKETLAWCVQFFFFFLNQAT